MMKKEDSKKPHFVEVVYPKDEPWRTDVYIGPRDGSGSHAHLTASGATLIYVRDINGKEVVNDFKKKNENERTDKFCKKKT